MSSWVSCQKIVFNLHKSWQLNKEIELRNFNYSGDQSAALNLKTCHDIADYEPDVILILDHKPHPLGLLMNVLRLMPDKKPRIIFHIFGDFTLYYQQWDKLAKLIAGHQVEFITASERQKNLIDKFLPAPMNSTVCPFPVDKNEFSYRPALRKLQRAEWGLGENDIAVVFTGRLSRQKRIHSAMRIFAEFYEKHRPTNFHLYFYGSPDHVGDQFLGKWETEGEYFSRINRIYKSFPEEIRERIHFKGSVPNSELKSVYQGADVLLNLSVHNDEDYGMSVAEAQCSGLPAILTDWGGLAGFFHPDMPLATDFIPVKIGTKAKIIDTEAVLLAFEKLLEKGPFKEREKLSELAIKKFGVETAGNILKDVLNSEGTEFPGFSPFFEKVIVKLLFSPTPYLDESRNINKLYREIYSSYVRHN